VVLVRVIRKVNIMSLTSKQRKMLKLFDADYFRREGNKPLSKWQKWKRRKVMRQKNKGGQIGSGSSFVASLYKGIK